MIRQGAEKLGWELEVLMDKTIRAMAQSEENVNQQLEQILASM